MKKTISIELAPVTFTIDASEGLTNDEILEVAKREFIKEISKKFPFYKYNIVDGTTINKEEVHVGVPIKLLSTGEKGIICDVNWSNKYPLSISLPKGKRMKCALTALEKLNKKTSIDKLIEGRESWMKEINEWHEGDTGYILLEGKKINPVIFGKNKKGTYNAYIVDHEAKGSYYTLSTNQLKFVFDTKEEAESGIR